MTASSINSFITHKSAKQRNSSKDFTEHVNKGRAYFGNVKQQSQQQSQQYNIFGSSFHGPTADGKRLPVLNGVLGPQLKKDIAVEMFISGSNSTKDGIIV